MHLEDCKMTNQRIKLCTKKCTAFLLILLFFQTSLANLIYDTNIGTPYGSLPVPANWLNLDNQQSTKEIVKTEINFALYTADWSSSIVTKYSGWWGVPANPAENVFYLSEDIPPFINIILDYKVGDFALYLELPFEKEYTNKLVTLSDHTNVPFNPLNPLDISKLSVDLNFPRMGYIYYSNDNLYLSIGRFPLKWGDAKYPVHISPTTYQDNLTFTIKFPTMIYTFHAIASYPLLSNQEYDIQRNYSDQHTSGRYFYEPSKYIIAHRFDFYGNVGDVKTRFGLGELNVVGGKHLDLIDINPILIFHNTYGEGYRNVTGSLDFSILWNSLKIYGEYVLDDVVGPTETGSGYKPGASSYNIGAQYDFGEFSIWAEYDEIGEWMYVTNYLPYLRINVRHFDLENNLGGRFMFDYPLGFTYGPDAKMFSAGLNGKIQDLSFEVVYNMLTKGLVDDNGTIRWKWFWDSWAGNVSESGATTPEKAGERTYNIFSVKANWKNITLLYKTIDFEKYFLSAQVSYNF